MARAKSRLRRFGRGGALRSRPLVTGDSVAASIVPSRCPSVVLGGSRRDPGEGWRRDWWPWPLLPGTSACGTAPRQRHR